MSCIKLHLNGTPHTPKILEWAYFYHKIINVPRAICLIVMTVIHTLIAVKVLMWSTHEFHEKSTVVRSKLIQKSVSNKMSWHSTF